MIKMDEGHVVKTDGILIADDLAPSVGANTYRGWMKYVHHKSRLAKLVMHGRPIPERVRGRAVYAEVEHGRWIAHCECGGTENISPHDPVFFCFSCLNADNDFHLRPVAFPHPGDRQVIEELLLRRNKHRDMGWKRNEPIQNLQVENERLRARGRAR